MASLETEDKMKLLTHNMLTSHMKGVKNGYPFKILVSTLIKATSPPVIIAVCVFVQASQVVANSVDFNREFIARMIPKLEWTVLKSAAESVST